MRRLLAGSLALLALAGCTKLMTPADIASIKVCSTNYKEIQARFGEPDKIGQSPSMVTWTYVNRGGHTLLVAFNNRDIVVDYAHNPAGLVELGDRCAEKEKQKEKDKAKDKDKEPPTPSTTL